MKKSLLISFLICFSAPFVKAQCANDSVCPNLVFARLVDTSWCMNGEVELFPPAVCPVDPADPCPGTWLLDSIVWNLGNGSEMTTDQYTSLVYQYNISDVLSISAVGYLTNSYGVQCEGPIVYIINPLANPCYSFNTDTTLYFSALSIQPFYSTMNLYSTTVTSCDSSLISFYHDLMYQPVPAPAPTWIYTLIIDGEIVQQDLTLPAGGVLMYQGYLDVGDHTIEIVYAEDLYSMTHCSSTEVLMLNVQDCIDTCLACNTFKPKPGERYWVSAWVKENHPSEVITYTDAHLQFGFTGSGQPDIQFYPTADIIDDWQRIVGSFTIPVGTTDFEIELVNGSSTIDAFFDDIRIHPFNASMKSYVYDHETFWLTAELDDNNYATFYEYDKEGQLIRIKKETARGIMTIQESRSANPKVEN